MCLNENDSALGFDVEYCLFGDDPVNDALARER